jgi:hypothetical protein
MKMILAMVGAIRAVLVKSPPLSAAVATIVVALAARFRWDITPTELISVVSAAAAVFGVLAHRSVVAQLKSSKEAGNVGIEGK